MNYYPESILKLMDCLTTLPGIGKKTAERLALHILHAPPTEAQSLADTILALKKNVTLCATCFGLSDRSTCRICSNPVRDAGTICVVENPTDMAAIEKTGSFSGLYHILGGALSPMDGIGPDEIRIKELFTRARHRSTREIILATGTDVEGEATAAYIADQLQNTRVCVTRIASGVPMGGDLHFVDQVTLQRAMEGRSGL
ncbi:MAG: recombination mediator RecR [Desulfobacterium sp.]